MPGFWNVIESSLLLRVQSSPCEAYYSDVLFIEDDCSTQWVQQMVVLEFVFLTLGALLQTVYRGVAIRVHGVGFIGRVKGEVL